MIPAWLQAVVLGVVQGLTEFIPVSSSGHLVLLPYVLAWDSPGLAFDVALHSGTAGAIVVYFRRDLVGMLLAVLGRGGERAVRLYRRMLLLLVLASAPVAAVGLSLKETFERVFQTPAVAAGFLLVTAGVLVGGERLRTRRVLAGQRAAAPAGDQVTREHVWTGDWVGDLPAEDPEEDTREEGPPGLELGTDVSDPAGKDLEAVGWRTALVVGLAQPLALFPGMSRSGTTIMAGVAAGMTRQAATRFSFLLALPALLGALAVSLPDLAEPGPYAGPEIAAGIVSSFVAGYVAIAFLVRLVARTSLSVFARYLVAAGALGLFASVMLGPAS